jgi:MFS family permease
MQRVLGFSPLEAGAGFVPLAVSAGAGGPLAAPLLARFGVRRVVVTSLLVTTAALVALSRALALRSYAQALLPVFTLIGFTFATAAVPLTAEAVADAAPDEQGAAAGLFQTFTHVGGAVVLAVLAISAAARSDAAHDASALDALVAGYRLAFVLAAIVLASAAAAFALLRREPRARPRGGAPRSRSAARRPRRSGRQAGSGPPRRRR